MQMNADYMKSGNNIKKTYLGERGVANILIFSNINGEFSICLEDEQNGVKSSWEMIMCKEDAKRVALCLAKITGIVPLDAPKVEPPKQLVLRARDDAELEQLKEAWSKGTINFTPIVAYTERTQDRWGKWVISEIQCPNCLEYFLTDCYSMEELNKCPCCNADMRGGAE